MKVDEESKAKFSDSEIRRSCLVANVLRINRSGSTVPSGLVALGWTQISPLCLPSLSQYNQNFGTEADELGSWKLTG